VEVWQTSNLRRLRLCEEKNKKKKLEETTRQKYNGLPITMGGRNKYTANGNVLRMQVIL